MIGVDVPWTIFVGYFTVMVDVSFPFSIVLVVDIYRVLSNVGSRNMVHIFVSWLEIVVAVSLDMVNDWFIIFFFLVLFLVLVISCSL